ncbi:hypothetical protein GCM10007275_10900 [Jeotgalicoccus coquinae]|nr:hypothetical protein GCM10007275_10900 [Jeotgalicoccus coquinae]
MSQKRYPEIRTGRPSAEIESTFPEIYITSKYHVKFPLELDWCKYSCVLLLNYTIYEADG